MPGRLNDNFALKNGGYSNYEGTTSLARHRWYYYKEGFSPLLVEKAIEEVGISENDIIIDPFNGSGTTTLAASIKGLKSTGIEVNPFTSFLSQSKLKSASAKDLDIWIPKIIETAEQQKTKSSLLGYSTFSETSALKKWLFNDGVLNTFESGWKASEQISSYDLRKLIRLGLISSAMQNCNATRDGKCLRYRETWKENASTSDSFLSSLKANLETIKTDIQAQPIEGNAKIINGDARTILETTAIENFKLCITSPPYLNTFDYTDIYRPELFLGRFVHTNQQLYNLRLRTVRSHVQAKWDLPTQNDFGILYDQSINHLIANKGQLMHKSIPMMVQAYFEDMFKILKALKKKATKDAQVWLVVSNSAYADMEIPVDLIIGDIGTKAGWYLKEIGVLRYIRRRKTKYSPTINELRESVIIFTASKK